MSIQTKEQVVLFAPEATQGTRPSAGYTLLPFAMTQPAVERDKALREDDVNGRLVPEPATYAGSSATITLECPLFAIRAQRASADPAVTCPLDALLEACGLEGSAVSSNRNQHQYDMIEAGAAFASYPSVTIFWEAGGLVTELNGCRGTMTLSFEAGREARASFEMTGVVASDYSSTTSAFTTAEAAAEVLTAAGMPAPPSAKNATLSLTSTASGASNLLTGATARGLTLGVDMGTAIEQATDITAAEGRAAPELTMFAPKINIQHFLAASGTNSLGASLTRDDGLYVFVASIPSADERGGVSLTAQVQATSASVSDGGGILREDIELSAVRPSGADTSPVSLVVEGSTAGGGGASRGGAQGGQDGAAGGQGGK